MPRPGEDRSDVGGAAQFTDLSRFPLPWGRATVTAKHPDRELLGVGGDYLDHVERALQR